MPSLFVSNGSMRSVLVPSMLSRLPVQCAVTYVQFGSKSTKNGQKSIFFKYQTRDPKLSFNFFIFSPMNIKQTKQWKKIAPLKVWLSCRKMSKPSVEFLKALMMSSSRELVSITEHSQRTSEKIQGATNPTCLKNKGTGRARRATLGLYSNWKNVGCCNVSHILIIWRSCYLRADALYGSWLAHAFCVGWGWGRRGIRPQEVILCQWIWASYTIPSVMSVR